ncbi:MAG: hypothetical protein ACK5A9_16765 [Pseudanabaena sp.]
MDRSPLTPTKTDFINLNIKKRSPSQHPQTRSPIPLIKQRSPLTTTKPDLLFLQIKQRSLHSWVY